MLDTSVMVAAVCGWHEHHTEAAADIEERLDRSDVLTVAGPALIEAYSVLTRLPPPHRLSPTNAHALLDANFLATEPIVLGAGGYRQLLLEATTSGIAGGQIYDAVIAACAMTAGIDTLVTLNARHFNRFAGPTLEIAVPGAKE